MKYFYIYFHAVGARYGAGPGRTSSKTKGTTTSPGTGWLAFLFLTRMFIFTKRFPVAHTRNHNHPQLGCISPTDGMVKDVSWFGHLGPHGGPEGLLQGSSGAPQ